VADLIGKRFGVGYGLTGAHRLLLQRFAWTWQKPERWAIERNEQAIAQWKRTVWPDIKNLGRRNPHAVFLDESGFLLILNVQKTWAPVGQTPILCQSYRHDKVSIIFAVTISSLRQWTGRYSQSHRDNINGERVVGSLRLLSRHPRGEVVLLWDGGKPDRNEAVEHYLQRCRRLHVHRFPAYAFEPNPDKHIWTQTKQALANSTPKTVAELECHLGGVFLRLQHPPNWLWSWIDAFELPWKQVFKCIHYLLKEDQ